MKILLIAANLCTDPYPVYPLGMSVIAAALESDGHRVRQFDALAEGFPALPNVLEQFQPDAAGISIRNLDTVNSRSNAGTLWHSAKEAVALCKTFRRTLPVFLGGPGFTLLPGTILAATGAEYGITGEGEEAVRQLIRELERNDSPASGIRHGTPGAIGGARVPDHLLNFYADETHIIPVQTKRGCPFHCVYCSYPELEGRTVRGRDPDEVLDSMTALFERRPDILFYLVDAVFNDPAGEYRKLLRRMEERDLRFPFAAFLTPSGLEEEDIRRMKACGMIAVELGIDAASDAALRGLGKNFTFARARDAAYALRDAGIGVTTNVLFGGPGETPESVREGIENMKGLEGVLTLIFSGIRVLRGTPIEQIAKERKILPPDWDPQQEFYYFEPGLDPEHLHRILSDAFTGSRTCVYPPDSRNRELQLLHRFGYRKIREGLES